MKRITYIIGLDAVKRMGISKQRQATALKRVSEVFGGITAYEGYGSWLDPVTNTLVSEPSLTIVVYSDTESTLLIESMATELRDLFHQSCVVVAIDNLEGFKYV